MSLALFYILGIRDLLTCDVIFALIFSYCKHHVSFYRQCMTPSFNHVLQNIKRHTKKATLLQKSAKLNSLSAFKELAESWLVVCRCQQMVYFPNLDASTEHTNPPFAHQEHEPSPPLSMGRLFGEIGYATLHKPGINYIEDKFYSCSVFVVVA